jgi:hypothetical protein
MSMAIDAKKITEKAAKAGARKVYGLSLDIGLMSEFQAECDKRNVKYSPVIEELIKEFLESAKKRTK